MPRRVTRFKTVIHPWIDPALSLRARRRAMRRLNGLSAGDYQAGVDVPYYAQFASPARIYDYIHSGYEGTRDPQWQVFGAPTPVEYAFWAPRVCALACLKMAIEAFYPRRSPSLWQLVQEGLGAGGYVVHDDHGRRVDEGWYYHAQVQLAERYGLHVEGRDYVSPLTICQYVLDGWLVMASVSPEIGERQPVTRHYGQHSVLVHGFSWQQGRPTRYRLHNPSGRFPELQANAVLPAARFNASFAYRLIALRPARTPGA